MLIAAVEHPNGSCASFLQPMAGSGTEAQTDTHGGMIPGQRSSQGHLPINQAAAVEYSVMSGKCQTTGKQRSRHLRRFEASAVDCIAQILDPSDRDIVPCFWTM